MLAPRLRSTAIASIACLSVVGLTACGSSNDDAAPGSQGNAAVTVPVATKDATAAGQVPANLRSKGTLKVAADPSYAPNEFLGSDGRTIIGLDADLAKALGEKLGIKLELQKASFDGIIAGLASKKYDLSMSSITDNAEREKKVDFVTYLSAGTSFFTSSAKPTEVTGLASLCGKSVAVERGTTQQADGEAQAKKCGSSKLDLQTLPDQSGANLAVRSGRADVSMADSPVADYQVKQSKGALKLVGTPYGTAPYGIAIPKGTGTFPTALQTAMKGLIKDGVYQKILDKWGLEKSAAIADPVINGAEG